MVKGQNQLAGAMDKSIEGIRQDFCGDWLVIAAGKDELYAGDKDDCPETPIGSLRFEPETHGFTEICICVSGTFLLCAGDKCYELQEGDACLLLPGAVHNEIPGRDYLAAWLTVDYSRVVMHLSGRTAGSSFAIADMHVFRPDYEYMRQIDAMRSEMAAKGSFYVDSIKAGMLRLLIAVRRELDHDTSGREESENWKGAIVYEVIGYIKDNLNSYIRLGDAAQAVCVSPNYLNLMFKASTGKTIIQYHEDCRMEIAKGLLKDTAFSINEISSRLGFYDQYHFSKAFKKACGMAPTEYRAANRH